MSLISQFPDILQEALDIREALAKLLVAAGSRSYVTLPA